MRKNFFLMSCICIFLVGCTTHTKSEPPILLITGADRIEVSEQPPGDDYQALGPVWGSDGERCGIFGSEGTFERAEVSLKNWTLRAGGDYAHITSKVEPHQNGNCFENEYKLDATAYKRIRDIPAYAPVVNTEEEDLTKKLRELKALLDDDILTQAEFDEQKAKLLENGF